MAIFNILCILVVLSGSFLHSLNSSMSVATILSLSSVAHSLWALETSAKCSVSIVRILGIISLRNIITLGDEFIHFSSSSSILWVMLKGNTAHFLAILLLT